MEPAKTTPEFSDAVPRAVEFLFHFVVRWFCFFVALCFGSLLTVAVLRGWHGMIQIVLAVLTLIFTFLFIVFGFAVRSLGKFRYDRAGPIIVVPAARLNHPQQPTVNPASQNPEAGETKQTDN